MYYQKGEDMEDKVKMTQPVSKWNFISRSIVSKNCKQVLVKELLDGREILMEKEENL
jgi:hypothetical protein